MTPKTSCESCRTHFFLFPYSLFLQYLHVISTRETTGAQWNWSWTHHFQVFVKVGEPSRTSRRQFSFKTFKWTSLHPDLVQQSRDCNVWRMGVTNQFRGHFKSLKWPICERQMLLNQNQISLLLEKFIALKKTTTLKRFMKGLVAWPSRRSTWEKSPMSPESRFRHEEPSSPWLDRSRQVASSGRLARL